VTEPTLKQVQEWLRLRPRKSFTLEEVRQGLGIGNTPNDRAALIQVLCRLVELKCAKDGKPAKPYEDATWMAAGMK
jgi:hypothetical protein